MDRCSFKSIGELDRKCLEKEFSEEEVWKAIEDCDGNKTSGPDGFNLQFFRKKWELVKVEVMEFFFDFYLTVRVDKKLNYSFITLIPKKGFPKSLGDYRPINLIGSIFKILAKVLTESCDELNNKRKSVNFYKG